MPLAVIDKYVDPFTKAPLYIGGDGNLYIDAGLRHIAYANDRGIYDFAKSQLESGERQHFDKLYKAESHFLRSVDDFRREWQDWAGFEELLRNVGDVRGKTMLLLGNGTSLKEMYFLWLGAKCVYTDLSVEAVRHVKAIFDQSEFKQLGLESNIVFHAVDACQLPFPDNSFDIIYGFAFVHHIQDLDKLFSEIARCLKQGGLCRFYDNAYSPLWQFLKKTVLKHLKMHTHRKHGISPADLIATERGGYTHRELEVIGNTYGLGEMLYLRFAFFDYLLWRGTYKVGCRSLRKLRPVIRALDGFLDRAVRLVKTQGIVLVWGFTK